MRTVEDVIKQYNHICWYPSAANDFRVLLYLSDWYYKKHNLYFDEDQVVPDLFILTDCKGMYPWTRTGVSEDAYEQVRNGECKPGTHLIRLYYKDCSTEIIVKKYEKLSDVSISYDRAMKIEERISAYNSACLMEVEITSSIAEETNRYNATILYVTTQNEPFANQFLIPNKICVEYQVIIRYADLSCRANEAPMWIIRSYKELGIRYLVCNDKYVEWFRQEISYKPSPQFESLYSIDGVQWSDYGPVSWFKLS